LAVEYSSERAEDDPGVLLLADLRELVDAGKIDIKHGMAAETACAALRKIEDRPWRRWKGTEGLRPVHLASLLRPFCKPEKVRLGTQAGVKRYPVGPLRDAFTRYLVQPSTPSTRSTRVVDGVDPVDGRRRVRRKVRP
jgi:hypothetical protein